ncbi:Uncharacterized protein OBRU01_18506 [Operophtera brumata]|uniref:Uncharacterized protein n=1 Tax=Operophtera brumata TaxID=104452 RepID=A0A0L7KNS3_OPEBR|nr:Uncharacterized protein OBRU01_18506 [Operophtera brumata]
MLYEDRESQLGGSQLIEDLDNTNVGQSTINYLVHKSPETLTFRLDDICRTCLNSGSIPIFGNDDISDDLKYFASVDVRADDCLPQHVCALCWDLLESAINFRNIAQKSDVFLRKRTEEVDCESQASQSASVDIEKQFIELTGSSDGENSDNGEYLEYAETVNESDLDIGSEKSDNASFNDTSSIPESFEPDPEELKLLVNILNKNARFPRCEVCNITFRTTEQVDEHKPAHDPQEIVVCEVCKNIIHKDSYDIHLKVHKESYNQRLEKKYCKEKCNVCGKSVGKSYLKRHIMMHCTDAGRLKKCTICDRQISANYLTDHMRRTHFQGKDETQKKQKPKQKCPVCSRMFKESAYKGHVASHAISQKKYICEECGKEFFSSSTFSTHILTHKDEYKFKCQFCPYRGKHLGLLKVHVRTHTKDYAYKCTTCDASFITKSNLNAHEKTHTTGVKFVCPECGKCFSVERTLKRHIVTVHEGIRSFSCDICEKCFGCKDILMAHKKKVHGVLPISRVGRTPSYLLSAQGNDDEFEDV